MSNRNSEVKSKEQKTYNLPVKTSILVIIRSDSDEQAWSQVFEL